MIYLIDFRYHTAQILSSAGVRRQNGRTTATLYKFFPIPDFRFTKFPVDRSSILTDLHFSAEFCRKMEDSMELCLMRNSQFRKYRIIAEFTGISNSVT